MERIDPLDSRPSITAEHVHRYTLAASISSGRVLDVSCGIGYAAPIFATQKLVTHYDGVDIQPDVITIAKERYLPATPGSCSVTFTEGSIYKLPFPDSSFDTVVTLETLEHLDKPEDALRELSRVVSETGVVVASVPTKAYDILCDSIFGPNPFHLSSFSLERFSELAGRYLPFNRIFVAAVALGTKVYPVTSHNQVEATNEVPPPQESAQLGSYILVGTKSSKVDLAGLASKIPSWQYMMNFVEFEAEVSKRLKKNIQKMQEIIDDRNRSIKAYQDEVERKNKLIKEMEQNLVKRWAIIEEYDKKLAELKQSLTTNGSAKS